MFYTISSNPGNKTFCSHVFMGNHHIFHTAGVRTDSYFCNPSQSYLHFKDFLMVFVFLLQVSESWGFIVSPHPIFLYHFSLPLCPSQINIFFPSFSHFINLLSSLSLSSRLIPFLSVPQSICHYPAFRDRKKAVLSV